MAEFFVWVETTTVPTWVRESDSLWAYPTVLTLHTFGLAIVVGMSAVLSLRLIGAGGRLPLSRLRVLFPVLWVGFWINAVTGTLLFAANAASKGSSRLFAAKLLFVAGAIVPMLVLERGHYYRADADLTIVSGTAKLLAAFSLGAWVAAITAGRLLAYV